MIYQADLPLTASLWSVKCSEWILMFSLRYFVLIFHTANLCLLLVTESCEFIFRSSLITILPRGRRMCFVRRLQINLSVELIMLKFAMFVGNLQPSLAFILSASV